MLKVGDKVKTDYYKTESDIVRSLQYVKRDKTCSSGYRAAADGGDPKDNYGKTGREITFVCLSWFKPA